MSENIYFNSIEEIEEKLNYELNCFSSHISGAELSGIDPSEVLNTVLPYIGYVINKANSMKTSYISEKTYRQVVEYFTSLFIDKEGLSEAYKDAYTDPMRDYFCDTKYISDFNNNDKNYSPDNTYLVLGLKWIFEKLVISDNCKNQKCLPLYTVHDSFDSNEDQQENIVKLFPEFIKPYIKYEIDELDLYALDYWGINKEELTEVLERRSQTCEKYDAEDKKNANNLNWSLILEPHYLLSRYKKIINLNPRQWNKDANSERMKLILLIYCFEKHFQINHIRSFKGINDRSKSMGNSNMYSEFINIPLLISDCNNHFSNTFDPTHTNSDIYDSLMYHVSLGVDIGHVCAYAQMMLQVSLDYNSILNAITETIRKLIFEYRAANDEDCTDKPVKVESVEKYIARLSDMEIDEKYNPDNKEFIRSHPFHCFYSFLKINQFLASIGVNFIGPKKQKRITDDSENVLRKRVLAVIENTDFSGFENIEIILPQGEKSSISNIRDELNEITLKPLSEIELAGRKIHIDNPTQNLSENQIEYMDYIKTKAKSLIKHIPDYEDKASSYNKYLKRESDNKDTLTIINSVMKGDTIIRNAISPLDFYICFIIRCSLIGLNSKESPYYFNSKKEKQKLISCISSRRIYSQDEAMLIRIYEDAKNTASDCYNKAYNDYLNEAIQRGRYIVNDKIRQIAGISDNQNENNDIEKFYENIKRFSHNVANI